MHARRGFARRHLLPEIAVLMAAAIALRWCERPEPGPPQPVPHLPRVELARDDASCWEAPPPCPSSGMKDAAGATWALAEIPGHTLRGLVLREAQWWGVSLRGATFIGCDFREADLREADVSGCRFIRCDLRFADLTDANREGVWFTDCRLPLPEP
jgi:hypothetical protein